MDEKGLGDIALQFTGLRPGEKLYEELLIEAENIEKTDHERILKSYEHFYLFDRINSVFLQLADLSEQGENQVKIKNILQTYVEGYKTKDLHKNWYILLMFIW